jgi:hypothetical protein
VRVENDVRFLARLYGQHKETRAKKMRIFARFQFLSISYVISVKIYVQLLSLVSTFMELNRRLQAKIGQAYNKGYEYAVATNGQLNRRK